MFYYYQINWESGNIDLAVDHVYGEVTADEIDATIRKGRED